MGLPVVLEVAAYLQIDEREAAAQLASILGRSWPAAGRRQVDFTPIETILCLAASLVVNHRKYGASNRDFAEEPIPSLARLFKRPNSSVLAKMANLDGSRSNGAKHEIEVASILAGEPHRLAVLYRRILDAARHAGIDPAALPDFLDLEGQTADFGFDGQDELRDADVEDAIENDVRKWLSTRADIEASVTERLLIATVRIGQHRFARGVLRNHGCRCVFCGLSLPGKRSHASRMLVASHIKPWRVSTPAERLDIHNGLAACPTHDVAFDTGLLTVNGGLRIHLQPSIQQKVKTDPAVRAAFGRPPLAERLLLPDGAQAPDKRYLAWHNDYVGWLARST